MALIECHECNAQISTKAKRCPQCGASRPFRIRDFLLLLIATMAIFGAIIFIGRCYYSYNDYIARGRGERTNYEADSVPASSPQLNAAVLELQSSTCYVERSYIYISGEVKNISNYPLKNIQAVAIYRTENGEFITSDTMGLEYNPLMPGQASPFKVMTSANPLMKNCDLDFKDMLGGSLKWTKKT